MAERDNYNNVIVDSFSDEVVSYELIKDFFGGYYVNKNFDGKREIIAKFPPAKSDEVSNQDTAKTFALHFWNSLKASTLEFQELIKRLTQ